MKFEKIVSHLVKYIKIKPFLFDSLDEDDQKDIIQMAQDAYDNENAKIKLEKENKRIELSKKQLEMEIEIEREDNEEERERLLKLSYAFNNPDKTHSIEDIKGTTTSKGSIQRSREFILYRKELMEKYKDDEYEIQRLLRIKQDELYKYLSKHYIKEYRNKNKNRVINKDIATRLKSRKQGKYVTTSTEAADYAEFPEKLFEIKYDITEELFLYAYIPSKKILEEKIKETLGFSKTANKNIKNPIYAGTVYVTISALNRFTNSTRNVSFLNMDGTIRDGWFEEFVEEIKRKYEIMYDNEKYAEDPSEITVYLSPQISINVYEIRSIRKWLPHMKDEDFEKMQEVIKGVDFSLFLAKDLSVDCEIQVFNRLNIEGEYDTNKSLYQNLDKYNIKYDVYYSLLKPTLVNRFRSFNLQKHKSTGIAGENEIKIIECDGHVGLIENVNYTDYKDPKIIHKRNMLKKSDTITKDVVLDIEAFVAKLDTVFNPYLVCVQEMFNKYKYHCTGMDCLDKTVKKLEEHYVNEPSTQNCIWAWNGAGFDYQYLLPAFADNGYEISYMEQGSRIIYSVVTKGEFTFYLKDMVLFLPMKLSKAAKAFEVEQTKGEFPYSIVEDIEDLEKIKLWYVEREEIERFDDFEEHIHKISLKMKKDYENEKYHVLDKAIEYCYRDVNVARLVWLKYKKMLKDVLNFEIPPFIITGSQLAFEMMRTMLPIGIKLPVPEIKREYDFFRSALYGGRVYYEAGIYTNLIFIDARSLYPTAMSLEWCYYPFGDYLPTNIEMEGKLGIYNCIFEMKEPEKYLNYTVRREEGKLKNDMIDRFEGCYTSVDIQTARDQGYHVKVKDGYYWESSSNTHFKEFVDTLYAIKRDSKDPSKVGLAKIKLNAGGYGKFVQRAIDQSTFLVTAGVEASYNETMRENNGEIVIDGIPIKGVEFSRLNDKYSRMIVPIEEIDQEFKYPTYIGGFVTSYARRFMYLKEIELRKTNPRLKIVYSDTDSWMILEESLDDPKAVERIMGKELGQFGYQVRKDGFLDEAAIGGRKMYGYKYQDQKTDVIKEENHIKSVPKRMVSYNDLCLLSQNKSLEFIFKIFKKQYTSVDYIDMKKTVKKVD